MTAPTRLVFRTPCGPLVVSVGADGALPVVSALFPDDRELPDPGTPPDLTLVPEADGFGLVAAGGRWHTPDLASLLIQLEMVLAEEMVRRSGLVGLHAGGVTHGGGALLLPGDGGTGKSSLTAALARLGCPVLGDDVVLLDDAGHAHPFRRLLKVEEPARTLLGLPLPTGPLVEAWPGASFYRPTELGATWSDPAPVRWLILPRRVDGAPVSLQPLRPAAVLPGVVGRLVLRDRIGPSDFETVARVVSGARCLEMIYGTTADAAEVLVSSLG